MATGRQPRWVSGNPWSITIGDFVPARATLSSRPRPRPFRSGTRQSCAIFPPREAANRGRKTVTRRRRGRRLGQPLPLDARVGLYIHRDAAGTTAIISTTDGKSVVWSVDPEHWEALACAIAGRNLSATEWQRYLSGHPYRATCIQLPDAAE